MVQAKRHSKNVGIDAIQQILAAASYYRTDEAWVVTNQNFTFSAKILAESNHVKLVNRADFINPEAQPYPVEVKRVTS